MVRYFVIVGAVLIASLAGRTAVAADAAQMEQNKKTVMALYDAALNKLDFEEAAKYLGPRYTQHNPNAKDGPEGLKGFIAFLKEKFPNNRSEIKRIFADGDYVIVACRARAGHARVCNLRPVQARERQGGRALGRGAADPGEGRQQQRDVLRA